MSNQMLKSLIESMIDNYLEESYEHGLIESIFEEVSEETWEAIEEAILNELSPELLKRYVKKAEPQAAKTGDRYTQLRKNLEKRKGKWADDTPNMQKIGRKNVNRETGIWRANKKLNN